MLEGIEQSLAQLVRQASEREQALSSRPLADDDSSWRALLDRLARWEADARPIEPHAADTDAALAAAADAASHWLQALAALRGSLADWAARAVS